MNCQRPLWRLLRRTPTATSTTTTTAVAATAIPTKRCFSQFPYPGSFKINHHHHQQPPQSSIPMPYITEVTERIICLNGPIDDTVSASVVAQLLWLESDNPDRPITMYIHSPGGSVTAGLSIYDTMTYIRSPVSTVCLGQAASMGSLLLAGGAKGKRYALPHSSVMIHQPLGGTQGPASDILIYANQIQRTREQVNEIYRKHLNSAAGYERYGLRAVEDLMDRDRYLTAAEAKEMGIVDEILSRRDKGDDGDNKAKGSPQQQPPQPQPQEQQKEGVKGEGEDKK